MNCACVHFFTLALIQQNINSLNVIVVSYHGNLVHICPSGTERVNASIELCLQVSDASHDTDTPNVYMLCGDLSSIEHSVITIRSTKVIVNVHLQSDDPSGVFDMEYVFTSQTSKLLWYFKMFIRYCILCTCLSSYVIDILVI